MEEEMGARDLIFSLKVNVSSTMHAQFFSNTIVLFLTLEKVGVEDFQTFVIILSPYRYE